MAVYGISFDPPEENRAWREMAGFEFPLLSDTRGEAVEALDARRPPDDKYHPMPQRITYLIDPDGVIRRRWLVGREEIAGHAGEVVAAVEELTAPD